MQYLSVYTLSVHTAHYICSDNVIQFNSKAVTEKPCDFNAG